MEDNNQERLPETADEAINKLQAMIGKKDSQINPTDKNAQKVEENHNKSIYDKLENYKKTHAYTIPSNSNLGDTIKNAPKINEIISRRKPKMSLKDRLVTTLGWFGYLLFYLIVTIITFIPLLYLDFPWWVDTLIILAVFILPFDGYIMLAIWIWSIFKVVNSPFDALMIIYLISAIIYISTSFIPWITMLFYVIKGSRNHV